MLADAKMRLLSCDIIYFRLRAAVHAVQNLPTNISQIHRKTS